MTLMKHRWISFFLYIFIAFCQVYNITKDKWNELYQSHPRIKQWIDILKYKIHKTYSLLIFKKMEPCEDSWSCVCWIFQASNNPTKYTYCENYFFTKEHVGPEPTFSDTIHTIVVIKTQSKGEYIVRMSGQKITLNQEIVYSKKKLVSVEYNHPKMKYSIDLTLPKQWFISGNELFSPTFVFRLLEYQDQEFIFDENYVLKIMDSDCSIFNMPSDSYICFTDESYEIKPNDFFKQSAIELDTTTHILQGDIQ